MSVIYNGGEDGCQLTRAQVHGISRFANIWDYDDVFLTLARTTSLI